MYAIRSYYDDPVAPVADGEHDAIAEAVIAATLILLDQHAQGDQLLLQLAAACQQLPQAVPAGRRIADVV